MALKGVIFNGETLKVPESLAELSQDENNRLVSDNEKAEWSGKQDKLIAGDNITISDDNTISAVMPTDDIDALKQDVKDIQDKIPTQATADNQLVDKNFMNSTVNSLAAFYITKDATGDPFATNAELLATTTFYNGANPRVPTTNDYAIVQADETKADELGDHPTTRYSYQGGTYPNGKWVYQYIVNRTSLTAAQIAAINSNITAELTAQITTNKNNIAEKANQSDLTALTTRVTAAETQNSEQDIAIEAIKTTADGAVQTITASNGITATKVGTDVTIEGVVADTRTLGVTYLHKAVDCGTFASDTGGATPNAVRKAIITDTTSLDDIFNATAEHRGTMSKEDKVKLDGLSDVATSGSYDDLTNKPDLSEYIPKTDIKTMSAVGDIGYGEAADRNKVISVEALSWWNGAYLGTNSNLQYFKNGEIAGKDEIPRPLWMADSIILEDTGIESDYTIPKRNISLLAANGYTIKGSDKIIFSTNKATYLGVVKSTTDTDVVVTPKFDMATVSFVEQSAGAAKGAVLYTEQTLTSAEQTQARKNIGAGTSDFDGQYSSLTGRPTLGTLASKNTVEKTDLAAGVQESLDKADTAVQPSVLAGYIPTSQRGANDGVASLNAQGKVPVSQLPSYVDDVQEFDSRSAFPDTGEDGKIYIAKDTNITYRWGGTEYVEISPSLALGETASTAYAGSKGKANADAIAALQTRATNIESKNASQDTAISTARATADAAMPKSGGQFTGRVSWNDKSLPENNNTPYFFVTIEGFDKGGKTYFTSISSAKTTLGITAIETKNTEQDTAITKAQSTADNAVAAAETAQSTADSKYTKPSGGIPATDLASDVQTSLGKADTAVQPASLPKLIIL